MEFRLGGVTMAKPILTDELWATIEPLLPVHVPSPNGGHPRVSDRAALTGILFVLQTGIPWEYLPKELGCGCGMTCWRRLRDWQKAGVWQRLHESVLHKLRQYDQIEWERASIDSASVPSPPRRGSHRPQSHRPGQARLQTSRHRRSAGAAPGSQALGGQCP
jgi:transposase